MTQTMTMFGLSNAAAGALSAALMLAAVIFTVATKTFVNTER